ncbi:SGNH/GDSL hydrolase family protein [uncultured Desulfobulbus sp.]|uniref:SGNH/GDSL hydrolase family protein n=1 Tax=uncultured Desulfobulbus sp. TaxID=239745 RepID=UPI0029C7A544|nr:SGNH/GDSL hydrolase family protein [uncultured Desulfobulbus sp.]
MGRFFILLVTLVAPFFCKTVWSADHITVRNFIISSHLAQMDEKAVLIIGDSIIESWIGGSLGNCRTLNAGLGGGGVQAVITLLHNLNKTADRSKIIGVVVAIGVNDTVRKDIQPTYIDKWKDDYTELVDIALQLSRSVAVSTILPVEDDMPLGTKYFDPGLIEQFNKTIRQVAKSKSIRVIEADKAIGNLKKKGHFTVDGVHLTSDAYKIFSKELQYGLPSHCNSDSGFEK